MNDDFSTEYTLIGVLTVIGLVVIVLLMWWGWRNRKRRQQDVAAPAAVPADVLGAEPLAAAEGMYVSTVRGQDYLDRIAVHGLGLRTNARLEVHASGVAVLREGSQNFFIPRGDLRQAGLDAGMSGKFVERGGLLVLTWTLDGLQVTTGFRTRAAQDRDPLLAALNHLIDPTPDPDPSDPTDPQMENNS
ncbi:hypothetical protein [Citricoccus sp. I39-566]|uniref:PH-like domain-containing protein n=1 Tax=Citricoccus sp. I39-566 TaxID=3073268 RepID=UPI00286C318B|nr:hypothetical protein [Citricoccus sp. I39-566]WMY77495.1 hypothetical protein RE421_11670 [Citricoccus sp. I39-566]